MKFGVLFKPTSMWVGIHYSPYNRRFCINLIPLVTIWITKKGGKNPSGMEKIKFWEALHRKTGYALLNEVTYSEEFVEYTTDIDQALGRAAVTGREIYDITMEEFLPTIKEQKVGKLQQRKSYIAKQIQKIKEAWKN